MKISLPIKDVSDGILRSVFLLLVNQLNRFTFLDAEWSFVEISFDAAVTDYKHKHGLAFVPKDVIQTSLVGSGGVTWSYAKFDSEYLYLTTTGACTVRAFVGRYKETP